MDSNKRKHALLQMPFGTANGKLRKMLLFRFAQLLSQDRCYRCKLAIDNIDDFTIEHKDAWMRASDPKEAFFDLNNIAFSHVKCNIRAAVRLPRKYATTQVRKQAEWARYYAKPEKREQVLERKRERYKKNTSPKRG